MNDRSAQGALLRLLRDAALIVLLAGLAGLVVNGRFLRKVWSGRPPAAAVSSDAAGTDELLPMPVSLEELQSMSAGAVMLLDARNHDLYLQGHLPTAYNLPWGEIEARLGSFLKEVPLDRALITYCSGYGCEDSFHLAQRLMAAGYEDVRVFEGGLPEWRDAGMPVEKRLP